MRTLHASEGPVEPAENLTLLFDYAGDPLFNEELTYIDVYGSVSVRKRFVIDVIDGDLDGLLLLFFLCVFSIVAAELRLSCVHL